MTKHELKKEIYENWVDNAGLVTLDYKAKRVPTSDNGVFFLVCFLVLLKKLGILVESDKENFRKAVKKLERIHNNKPIKGLYNRWPGKSANKRSEAHDNYVAISTGSVICEAEFHKDILAFGERNGFCYSNVDFKWKIAQCRQGADVAFYKIINKKWTTYWNSLWLAFSILSGLFLPKGETSPKKVTWLRLEGLAHESKFWKTVQWMWYQLTKRKNPGGMPEIFHIYYTAGNKKLNPIHPIIELCELAFEGEE